MLWHALRCVLTHAMSSFSLLLSRKKGISDPYCVCLVGFAVPNYTDLGGGAKKTKKLSLEEYPDRQRTPTVWDNADPVWNVRETSRAAPRPTQCR